MTPIAISVTHTAAPGGRDLLVDAWMRHMPAAVTANPGHLAYVYCVDDAHPDSVPAFQLHATPDDARAFLTHPGYLAYLEDSRGLLTREPHVRTLSPLWMTGVVGL